MANERDAHQKNLRKGRFSRPGYAFFITTNSKNRLPLFADASAARIILDSLKWLTDQGRITLIAAVVMPDHLHFVMQLHTGTVQSVMHSLKSFTSNKINVLLGREGPLWEPQYHDHGIRNDEDLKESVRYCLENPVRKGLVEDFRGYPHWYCIYEI